MATELASGFINLTVKYSDGMRKINQDLVGLERTAQKAGTDAGNALSQSLGRATKLDASDAKRTFAPLENVAKNSGNQAGESLGKGIILSAKRKVSSGSGEITEGLEDGMGEAGGSAGDALGEGLMTGIGPKLAQLGTKAGPIGVALLAAVGLAAGIGALLAKEVSAGFERDMANRKLQVQLGIDPSQMASVNEAINNAYKNNFGESVDALRENAAAIIKNGLVKASDTQGLQTMLQQFDTVAQVTGSSVDEIARSVGVLVKSGVAKDTASALDLITVAAQQGLDVSGDLMDTLTEYSVQFKKIGVDGPQALGLIKQLMDGGARSTDLAADALKEFSIRAIDGSKSTVDAYTSLGLSAQETMQKLAAGGPAATQSFDEIVDKLNAIQDPVERDRIGVELFGTQWEDLGAAMRKLDPSNATNAIGQVDGAVQKASDTLGGGALSGFESLGRTFEVLRGKFQDFLATAFGPMAKSISDWIVAQLPKLQDAFENKIMPAVQNLLPVFNELWDGIKAGAGVLQGEWLDNFKTLWPDIQKFGEAAKEAFVAALPVLKAVGIAVGVLILAAMKLASATLPVLVTAFTALYKAIAFIYETVGPAITTAFNAIGTVAMWLWNNAIQPAWQGIQSAISTAWSVISTVFDAFKVAITAVGSAVQFAFNDFILPMWQNFQTVVGAAWSVISPIWDGIKTGLSAIGDVFTNVFASSISPVWDSIKNAFSTGWAFLSGIFESMKGGFKAVADFISGVWNGISGGISSALDAVVNAMRGPLHAIGDLLASVPQSIGPIQIPGADTAHALGATLQAFRTGGAVSGPGGTDNVLAWLTAGEGVVTKQAMANGGSPIVQALNAGWVPPSDFLHAMLPGFADGGPVGKLYEVANALSGKPYVWGGHGPGGADCSGAASILVNALLGLDPYSDRMATANAQQWLSAKGAVMGKGPSGTLRVGWKNGGAGGGHMAVTLPDGRNAESGGSHGDFEIGGDAAGADDPQFTNQAYIPFNAVFPDGSPSGGAVAPGASGGGGGGGGGSLNYGTGATPGGGGSGGGGGAGNSQSSSNPYTKIMEGIKEILPDFGQLADIGLDGLKETFLPPGFSDPQEWGIVKTGAAVAQFIGGLVGGIPGMEPVGKIIGGVASVASGDASGAVGSFMDLLPPPFGEGEAVMPGQATSQPGQGTGPLPGPSESPMGMNPDPTAGGGGGNVNVDNSVHVAENGSVGTDPNKVLEATNRQQVASQTPQLGTRRFV